MKVLVTGGAGFIGCNLIRHLLQHRPDLKLTNLDKLTYSGNRENLSDVAAHPNYEFAQGDVADAAMVNELLNRGFDSLIHLAAETHVDRSIENAHPFLRTNVVGTHVLLEAARTHQLPLFVHVSTDEVYGSAAAGTRFAEEAPLRPRSPYAASKAAADLLVLAYVHTYRLPALIVRLSNTYGPYQFPEKLIPLMIANALENKPLPVYGDGLHERDWLYVEDGCRALQTALERGQPGEIYNVSAGAPLTNLAVVATILEKLDQSTSRIAFVEDRPGHDRRYALDSTRIRRVLGWAPRISFAEGIERTVAWFQANRSWLERCRSGEYRQYYDRQYGRRLEKAMPG